MGDTNISSIGKILAVTATVSGLETQNLEIDTNFADMMSQTSMKNANQLVNNNQNQMGDALQKNETSSVKKTTDDFGKYQYKDNRVTSGNKVEESTDPATVNEKVSEFADAVNEVLEEELGVSEEDIANAMETLGLSYLDLLDRSNLANLVAELTGVDHVSQLLCNEQFLNVLQNVSEIGQELLEELALSPEELQGILDQNVPEMVQTQEQPEDTVVESAVTESQTTAESVAKTVVPETNSTEPEAVTEHAEQPEVIVNVSEEASANEEKEESQKEMQKQQPEEITDRSKLADVKKESLNIKGLFEEQVAHSTTVSNQTPVLEQVAAAEPVQNLPEFVTVRDIIEQIVDATRVTMTNEVTKMEMQLNPENLGKVFVEITEREGVLSAKLQTQNLVVKEALEAQMADLRENLNQAGIRVEKVEVTIASHEFERNLEQDAKGEQQHAEEQQKALKSRRTNLNELDELSGLMTEEEALVARMMAEQGNSVDYTA